MISIPLVDDEPAILDLAQIFLERGRGTSVSLFESGTIALEMSHGIRTFFVREILSVTRFSIREKGRPGEGACSRLLFRPVRIGLNNCGKPTGGALRTTCRHL
jgi:hypothetical protein